MAGGHAVTCYGWGLVQGVDAWKCINSWGADWGEEGKGIFYIKKGSDVASMESMGCTVGVIDESKISGLPPRPPPAPPAEPSPPLTPPPPTPPSAPGLCETRGEEVTSCDSLDPSGSEDAVAFCAHHWSAAGAAADGSWALCGGAFTCEKNGKCFGECAGRDGFDAGYGSCSTYASNIRNSNYDSCGDDNANQACSECGRCADEPTTTSCSIGSDVHAECQTKPPFPPKSPSRPPTPPPSTPPSTPPLAPPPSPGTPAVCGEPTKCYGHTCDDWVPSGYTCEQLEGTYGCDCAGCYCGAYPPPPPTACDPTCSGQSCDFWVGHGYACKVLEKKFGCNCEGCAC